MAPLSLLPLRHHTRLVSLCFDCQYVTSLILLPACSPKFPAVSEHQPPPPKYPAPPIHQPLMVFSIPAACITCTPSPFSFYNFHSLLGFFPPPPFLSPSSVPVSKPPPQSPPPPPPPPLPSLSAPPPLPPTSHPPGINFPSSSSREEESCAHEGLKVSGVDLI